MLLLIDQFVLLLIDQLYGTINRSVRMLLIIDQHY